MNYAGAGNSSVATLRKQVSNLKAANEKLRRSYDYQVTLKREARAEVERLKQRVRRLEKLRVSP